MHRPLTALLLCCVWLTPAHARNSTVERMVRAIHLQARVDLAELAGKQRRLGLFVYASQLPDTPRAKQLVQTIALRLLGEIKKSHRFHRLHLLSATVVPPIEQQLAQARREGLDRLLSVEITIRDNHVLVYGRLWNTSDNFWLWGLQPALDLRGHYVDKQRVDAEINFLLGKRRGLDSRPTNWAIQRFALGGGERILAAATGDIDGDGQHELVLLTLRSIRVYRWEQNRFRFIAPKIPLDTQDLRRRVSRHPFGNLLLADIDGDKIPEIIAGTSEHKNGWVFRWRSTGATPVTDKEKQPLTFAGIPLARGPGTRLIFATPHSRKPLYDKTHFWDFSRNATRLYPISRRYFSFVRRIIKTARHQTLLSGMVDAHNTLLLFRGGPAQKVWQKVRNVGIAFTITDLDDDGIPELVTTSARFPGERDNLTVWQLGKEKITQLFQSKYRLDPVIAVTSGDVDNDGQIEVLFVTISPSGTSHLHLLRRVP